MNLISTKSIKKPIKLLFVIDSLIIGGAQRQLVELVKGLDKDVYQIHLIDFQEADNGYFETIRALDVKYSCLARRHKYDLRPIFLTYRYIRQNRIDLVHTFMNLGSVFGVMAAKLAGCPVACAAIRDAKSKGFKEKISKQVLASWTDIFMANSQAGFTSRFKKMRPNFRLVYNGMDLGRFNQVNLDKAALKKELGLDRFGNLVAMVGTMGKNKDHDTLLEAVPKVINKFPDTGFALVGDGPRRKHLEEKTKKMGLEDNVRFLGFRNDIEAIYAIIDLKVLIANATVNLEGISNAITEAMASGIPVIASSGGGTDELIQNGITGLMVPPKNSLETARAIISLIDDKPRAKAMAEAGRKMVAKRFGLGRYIRSNEALYHELLPTR